MCRCLAAPDRHGRHADRLYTLAGVTAPSSISDGAAEPVIFRVHTHDPTCIGDDCLLPVIESVVWTGTASIDLLGEPPTGGTSAAMAGKVAIAQNLFQEFTTVRVTAAITLAGLEAATGAALSGPGTTPASWVWVVVLTDGSTPARSAADVIVDMRTGKFLFASTNYP